MPSHQQLRFSGPVARVQYTLLMALFRIVRWVGWRAGYGAIARGLGRIFGPHHAVWLTEPGGAPYKVYLNDGYWTRFALFHSHYQPEVAVILHAARGHAPLFCDLGADGGYWTVRAAGHFDHVIAVEASARRFARLEENAGALPDVTLRRAAIHAASGQTESVEALAIDDLVPPGTAALIRIDVEGAEIAALTGAARAISDGAVLVYEDHGNDPDCAPSAHLLNDPAMRLFALENGFQEMTDLAGIHALKTDPCKGYNFVAGHHASPLLAALRQALQSRTRAATT